MIRIINTRNQEFDYYDAEDLGITFNRIIDDYTAIDQRFSEFSYQFELPKTKNNNVIFNHASVHNVIDKFTKNRQEVYVYINDILMFNGVIELDEIDDNNYYCTLLSKVSQLTDELGDKELVDLEFDDPIWDYETTIKDHIEADYENCDDTLYQFPFIFYSTYQTPQNLWDTREDAWGYDFQAERAEQNFLYFISSTSDEKNIIYFHQLPLAMYLKPVIENIFESVGWGVSSSLFETDEFKRIIMPYVGDADIYDDSVYCDNDTNPLTDGTCVGAGNLRVRLANFLPDMTCVDFINNIINVFNLYFTIDLENRIIRFETYDTFFNNKNNVINLDNKIDQVNYLKPENSNISINFNDQDNEMINGDNTYYEFNVTPGVLNPKKFNRDVNIYNKRGKDDSIDLEFGKPTMKRTVIYNHSNYTDEYTTEDDVIFFQPMLTKQNRADNDNMPFVKSSGETNVDNTEDRIKHSGSVPLLYYYGISNSQEEPITDKGELRDWLYFNLGDYDKVRIPLASPFGISSGGMDRVKDLITNEQISLNQRIYASLVYSTYYQVGDKYTNSYSLVFNDYDDVVDTLYTKFHRNKYKRYEDGYVIEARIRMDIYDYNRYTMNRPLSYRQEMYSLVSIEEFDPVNNIATIRIIRQ